MSKQYFKYKIFPDVVQHNGKWSYFIDFHSFPLEKNEVIKALFEEQPWDSSTSFFVCLKKCKYNKTQMCFQ